MDPNPVLGFHCYEGKCYYQQKRRVFPSQKSLRQHRVKVHHGKLPPGDSSIERSLKRRHEEEEENHRKRQRLEDECAAAPYTPEPELRHEAPLLEREVDVDLVRRSRGRRVPVRLRDYLPTSTIPSQVGRYLTKRQRQEAMRAAAGGTLPEPNPDPPRDEHEDEPSVTEPFMTGADQFGIYRKYSSLPSHNPDDPSPFVAATSSAQSPTEQIGSNLSTAAGNLDPLEDSDNPTLDLLLGWFSEGITDGVACLDRLVKCLQHPLFDVSRLNGFNAASALRRFEKKIHCSQSGIALKPGDGWKCGSVTIRVPCVHHPQKEEDAPEFTVDGVWYRDVVEVITKELEKPDVFENIHLKSFEEWWKPTEDSEAVRVYSETYTSDATLALEKKLEEKLKNTVGPQLETFLLTALFYSDATKLAQFGQAHLWPVYMYIGNASKYIRSQPNSFSAHHIAYLPTVGVSFYRSFVDSHLASKLPDTIKEFYLEHYHVLPSDDMMAHLKRELIHGALRLVVGGSFAEAKENGCVTKCADDVLRRWFLELLLHSADYIEKALIECMKALGKFLCPRCLVIKADVPEMGKDFDMKRRQSKPREYSIEKVESARRAIFDAGRSISYKGDIDPLKEGSWVPTRNAYVTELGTDPTQLQAVDLMHDFELGVGKAVVLHVLRLLVAVGGDALAKFDTRFRRVPTFGRDTIRKFSGSVSSLKKMTAKSFEDILQCWMPVVEGLLPEPHNSVVQSLIFDLATWHAYAKLRKHTEHTVKSLRSQTKELGRQLRLFTNKTCSKFNTKRLPSEEAARIRRRATQAKKGSGNQTKPGPSGPEVKRFNLSTYKLHALGDYADHIERFGPTDCFTTQHGEREHRRVKGFYKRTNKSVSFPGQIAKQERFQRHYKKYIESVTRKSGRKAWLVSPQTVDAEERSPKAHYWLSNRGGGYINLYQQAYGDDENDPALRNFVPKLTDHLLARILGCQYDPGRPGFTEKERDEVLIHSNRLQQRFTMTVYYTTYDLQRHGDKINLKGRPYVTTLSHGDPSHPYQYARVLGIYRVSVQHPNLTELTDMDVLWVRWLEIDRKHKAGWKAKRMYRLQFVPSHEEGAFGFLDPADVIRGVQLLPGFDYGLIKDSREVSKWDYAPRNNWRYYYVSQFVDRDTFMRYRGGGIGHRYMRELEEVYETLSRERDHHKSQQRQSLGTDSPGANADNGDDGDDELSTPEEATNPPVDDDNSDSDSEYEPDSNSEGSGSSSKSDTDDLDSEGEIVDNYGLGDL